VKNSKKKKNKMTKKKAGRTTKNILKEIKKRILPSW